MSAPLPAARRAHAEHARSLRAGLERRLVQSLTELLGSACTALSREPVSLQSALSAAASPDSKLPPWLFGLNARLQRCMRAGDGEAVARLLTLADALRPRALPARGWQIGRAGDAGDFWHIAVEMPALEPYSRELPELQRAADVLREGAPELHAELDVLLAQLAVCESRGFNGACDPELFGLALLHRPRSHHHPLAYFLEQLIHCGAQLHWICRHTDRALLATRDPLRIESPWNRQPVTSYELLFELFWLDRAVPAFRAFSDLTAEPAIAQKTAVLEHGYRSVLELAEAHLPTRLTAAGRSLLGELAQTA